MGDGELLVTVKGFVLLAIVIIGLSLSIFLGVIPLTKRPLPEPPLVYRRNISPVVGADVGEIKITLTPGEAFVLGEYILADVEIYLGRFWTDNGSALVILKFPFSMQWIYENYSRPNGDIHFRVDNSTNDFYVIYSGKSVLWYTHEGFFGANLTIICSHSMNLSFAYGTSDRTTDFAFPNIVQIKPYSYVEQRRNAHLTTSLAFVVLGLSIISTIPAVDRVFDAFIVSSKKKKEVSQK